MGSCGRQETYGEAATQVQREEQACHQGYSGIKVELKKSGGRRSRGCASGTLVLARSND